MNDTMKAPGLTPGATVANSAGAGSIGFSSVPAVLSEVTNRARSEALTLIEQQQAAAYEAASQLQQDQDGNAFVAKMEAQRQQGKSGVDAIIDQAYDGATQIGRQNPSQQDLILTGTNILMNTVNNVSDAVNSAISDLAANASDVDGVVARAQTAFNSASIIANS